MPSFGPGMIDNTFLQHVRFTKGQDPEGQIFEQFDSIDFNDPSNHQRALDFTRTGFTIFVETPDDHVDADPSGAITSYNDDNDEPSRPDERLDLVPVRPSLQARKPKAMPSQLEPTRQERELHNRTHPPFSNWCEHCVQAKGKQSPHFKTKNRKTVIQADFAFLSTLDEPK